MTPLRGEIEKFRTMTGVPAVWAGTVTDDGDFVVEAVGVRQRNDPTNRAATTDQVHIGSCGKSMTSALYARLVEAGQAEWGLPVTSLFDDIDDVDSGWSQATIDDLLRCRGGVAPNPPRSEMKALFEATEPLPDQRTAAATSVLRTAPKTVGTFVYSNLGYILAGAAIERLAGMTFEEAVQSYVAEPLGMSSLGFGPAPLVSAHRPKLQLGPLVLGKGEPVALGELKGDNPPVFSPAGRHHLTIEDWSRFLRFFLREGDGFLTQQSIDHLLHIPEDNKRSIGMGWGSAQPHGSFAMQGSNTMWAATAFFDRDMNTAAMAVANDGRSTTLRKSALLALRLIETAQPG